MWQDGMLVVKAGIKEQWITTAMCVDMENEKGVKTKSEPSSLGAFGSLFEGDSLALKK